MNKKKINILITGCGGDLGISIGKICKEANLFNLVIGTNNHNKHPASLIYDKYYLVDSIDSENYKSQINTIIKDNEIDIIVPVSEIELRKVLLDQNFMRGYFIKPILCANIEALKIGLDKYSTIDFLKKCELPYPQTELFNNNIKLNFPYLIKPRSGYGSKSIYIIKSKKDFVYYNDSLNDYVAQEIIDVKDSEYTCGLFRSKNSHIRTIIIKRELSDGTTSYGEIVQNEAIEILLNKIAININLVGSINVQLRLLKGIPYVFEINPRFSSTVRFRDLIGFKDFIWSIQDFLNLEIDNYVENKENIKIIKISNEIILKNENK